MSEYVPQVGDRVRWSTWSAKAWVDVLHIDGMDVFGRDERGAPTICALDDDPEDGEWEKVPTFPERWINVYAGMVGADLTSSAEADRYAMRAEAPRIGVIHLHPDGTLTMESAS